LVRYIAENESELLPAEAKLPSGYLALLLNGRVSQSLPLPEKIELGRDKNNTIIVADRKVSRIHASLSMGEDGFIITDLGSANGTFVNNILIKQPTPLKNKDKISVGDTTFIFTTPHALPDGTTISSEPLPQELPSSSSVSAVLPANVTNPTMIWLTMGCLTLTIIILLIIIAFLLGIFLSMPPKLG